MKKYVNGAYIEMTEKEIEDLKRKTDGAPEQPLIAIEERLDKMDQQFDEIKTLLNIH